LAALPVAAEINAWLVAHRQSHDPVNLAAVRIAPVILPPCRFLRKTYQVGAGDMMMVTDLRAPHPAEKAFGVVGINLLFRDAVGFLMVDPVQLVTGMQVIPRSGLVRI
jgi:hypothetical protein